jgi:pyrimidine operon attenuation protein/uracil phosphoribosyltransferase
MKEKARLLDREAVERSLMRIAHEILEKNKGTQELCLVGIRTRGAHLAKRLQGCIEKIENRRCRWGYWTLRFTGTI